MFKDLLAKKIIKNIGYIVFWRGLNNFLFLVLTVFISRILGVEGVGAYGFIFALTGFIFLFSSIGGKVFTRDIINNQKYTRKFWGNFLILKFLNNLIIYIILIIVTIVFPIPEAVKQPIYLTGLILFWGIFSESAYAILVAYQKIKSLALTGIFSDLLIVSLSISFILSGKGLSWIVISFAIGELVKSVILNFILLKKFSMPELKVDMALCAQWVKKEFYFMMQRCFSKGLLETDIMVIFLMSGLYATGLYQAPYKITVNIDIVPILFGIIFYPYYINMNRNSFKKLRVCYTKYRAYIMMASMVLCLFLFIFSKQIIVLIYGDKFLESIPILRVLIVATLFLSLNSNNLALLNAIKKERICFYLYFFIFLLNLLLDIVLIKPYGVIGVAISTAICSGVFFITTESYIKRLLKR